MKITSPLTRQNLYRMMRNQWKVKRKHIVIETPAEQIAKDHNLEVIDANAFVQPPATFNFDFSSIVGLGPKPIPKDKSHPLYKEKPCFMYRDYSVLLEGLDQALNLTNTVQLQPDTLPVQVDSLHAEAQLPIPDDLVKRCIKTSLLYDAEQKLLPKRKDPDRQGWNFPRDYGITESRKIGMLCCRLLHLCALASPEVSFRRAVLNNVPLSVPLSWEDDNVQIQLRADMFLCSEKPLPSIVSPTEAEGCPVPELSISHPLISLEEEHFYELQDIYPLKKGSRFSEVHTIIVHYNHTEVKNIFETPVTMTQTVGRALMKAYTAAMTQARYKYGVKVKDLPEPVVVQCVQTDGRTFNFCVLQLNSADVNSNRRNVFYSRPSMDLYEVCSYVQGVPTLQGYNPQVFKQLVSFYMNN